MPLIDTHSHLYLEDFDPEQPQLIHEAVASGISKLLLPNVDLTTIERMHQLADQYPEFAYPMMGLHPTSVNKNYATDLKEIESWLHKRSYCAIGEIGIDLYWDKTYLKEQKTVFTEQLKWSVALDLPVAIHTRDAFPEVLACIHAVGSDKLHGVFHSFGGTIDELNEIKKLTRFKIGINGVVTFKNANLTETLKQTDINHIVLETDAPYLAPVPYRGKRNNPIYIWKVAEKLAQIYHLPLEKVIESTSNNALMLFQNISSHI
ncbi:TatD family hydrolase [Parabacteroides sp. PF5-9]|uniref:TatD family hydrolase n=1 Tax=Parabacteroides sp. PF5-9 TaxID=1742404 RepID=UPI00247638D9|nr:TatD family hydrolase [Parabacteroides sp. PF5-9]MDH6358105.1 TatD DNase family protein [Parabacteroides sp. PF5-9]